MSTDFKNSLKKSARGSITLAFSQVFSTILLAIGMLVVARNLGSSSWGILSIANSIVTLVQLFQDLGLRDSLIKYISQNKHQGKNGNVRIFIESGLLVSIISSTFLTGILVLLSDYIAVNLYQTPELGKFIRYLSLAIIGRALLFASYGVTVGFERMGLRGSLRIIYTFLKSIISPFLVLLGFGVMGGVIGEVGPILMTGAIGLGIIIMLHRSERDPEPDIDHIEAMKTLLKFGGPLYFANFMTSIRTQLITFLLGIYVGDTITGNWTVVLWFSSLLSFVNLPIRTSIFPLLSKITDPNELEFIYRNSVKFATLLIYPLTFTVMALSDQIIETLFTSEYSYASTFLRLYMVTFLFAGIGSLANIPLLNSQKYTSETLNIQLIQFLVTMVPSLYVIPRFGAEGAIILLFVGVGVSKAYAVTRIRSIFGFKLDMNSSIKLLAAGSLGALCAWGSLTFVQYNSWIELVLGGFVSFFVYAVCVLLLRVLSEHDFRRLKGLESFFGKYASYYVNLVEFLSTI